MRCPGERNIWGNQTGDVPARHRLPKKSNTNNRVVKSAPYCFCDRVDPALFGFGAWSLVRYFDEPRRSISFWNRINSGRSRTWLLWPLCAEEAEGYQLFMRLLKMTKLVLADCSPGDSRTTLCVRLRGVLRQIRFRARSGNEHGDIQPAWRSRICSRWLCSFDFPFGTKGCGLRGPAGATFRNNQRVLTPCLIYINFRCSPRKKARMWTRLSFTSTC